MRYLLLSLLLFPHFAWADRVCLEKDTGKLIEYQSSATPGTLVKNATAAGYSENQVTEQEVTPTQWTTIKKQWIDDPLKAERAIKEATHQKNVDLIKAKLNLSDADFEALKDALSNN